MKLKKGLVHIYTGEGKGKTTAALGLALRASGCGLRVCVFQLFKDKKFLCGEADAARLLGKNFTFKRLDCPHPFFGKTAKAALKRNCKNALNEIKRGINSKRFDLVIVDEIIVGVSQGLIDEKAVIKIIKSRPAKTELVLTGRGMTRGLAALADYVTYMKDVKHPFRSGVKMRRGVEF